VEPDVLVEVEVLVDVAAYAVETISNNKIKLNIAILFRIIPPLFISFIYGVFQFHPGTCLGNHEHFFRVKRIPVRMPVLECSTCQTVDQ